MLGIKGRRVNWLDYFSLNNIELEILLNCIGVLIGELRACELKDLIKPHVFKSINPSLVDKLVSRGVLKKFHKHGRELYTLTSRGLKAFISTAKPILDVVRDKPGLSSDKIAEGIKDRVFYGGIHRVHQAHVKLVNRILDILVKTGFIREENGVFYPGDKDSIVNALATMISSLSSIAPIRRIEELIDSIVSSLGLENSVVDELLSRVSAQGIIVGDKDPGRALIDLFFKADKKLKEYIHNGKLFESLAYEALTLEILKALEKISGDNKLTRRYWIEHQFRFYEILGDYFYQNLNFEAAKQFYHLAVSVARNSLDMAKEAHRANAKYLLSLARSLASRGKYHEALARLDELIGYYQSTGLMREALIAEALRHEYMAEIEVRRNKPCNAYKSWLEAASKYDGLGGGYKSKAEALRVKALISRAECLLYSEKKVEEAIKILEEASRMAEDLLSPHLRNVARSLLHEARATILVTENKYDEASREYAESARFYELRGYINRSLLNTARSYKFHGFYEVLNNDVKRSMELFDEARKKYLELLRNITRQYYRGRSLDYYMVKEALKGYHDATSLLRLAEVVQMIRETSILNDYILKTIIERVEEAIGSWVEAGRDREYEILRNILLLIRSIAESESVESLIKTIGEIAELNDKLSDMLSNNISPRQKVFLILCQKMLSMIKSSLETITRYIEELGIQKNDYIRNI